MRENRLYGSEGGASNDRPYPYSLPGLFESIQQKADSSCAPQALECGAASSQWQRERARQCETGRHRSIASENRAMQNRFCSGAPVWESEPKRRQKPRRTPRPSAEAATSASHWEPHFSSTQKAGVTTIESSAVLVWRLGEVYGLYAFWGHGTPGPRPAAGAYFGRQTKTITFASSR
jgi:hypothetical protein